MAIDNRWRYSLLFFYRISIRLYFFTIDFQPWLYCGRKLEVIMVHFALLAFNLRWHWQQRRPNHPQYNNNFFYIGCGLRSLPPLKDVGRKISRVGGATEKKTKNGTIKPLFTTLVPCMKIHERAMPHCRRPCLLQSISFAEVEIDT